MKILSLVIVLGLISLVSGFFFWHSDNHCLILSQNDYWSLEVARTPEQHSQGLMNRNSLCRRCGMLFVFDAEKPQTFWMKNTRIPLDIYFYDKNGLLVDEVHNMKPMHETETPMTYTSKPSQYVLEINAGVDFQPAQFPILNCK